MQFRHFWAKRKANIRLTESTMMMMDVVAPSIATVVTPAASREETATTTATNNVWLDRLLRGESLAESEWQRLGTQEKSEAALLTSSTAAGNDTGRLVRFTGMVQDMLDAEYFPISAVTATTSNGGNLQLAERAPLVIVPFERLLQQSENNITSISGAAGSTQQLEEHRNKRAKFADEDASMDCDDDNNTINRSKPLDCALAKFYYDQYPESSNQQQQRPRLNQMVEVLGVLEESPQLLESPTTANTGNHQHNNNNHNHNNDNDTPQSTDSNSMFWQRSMDDYDVPTVPSTVPCLHVLWYQPVSHLEDLTPDAALHISASTAAAAAAATTTTALLAQLTGADPITAQALAMLLQSQAERSDDKASNPILTPQETVLGCASLQVQSPTDAVDCLAQRLTVALRQLVPLVRVVELSSQQQQHQSSSIAAPHKSAGRLQQTDLQLPAGSVVVVKCSQPPHLLSPEHRETLQQLCQGHRLQYAFDGGVRIPFEADYRVVVLSASSDNLFGCALQVQCSSLEPLLSAPDAIQIAAARASLAAARRIGNVGVPHSVLDKAQHDFLKRRAADRKNIGESEFHRWLTLTRLHARANARPFATAEDWDAALRLDDSMRASLVPSGGKK